MTKRIRLLLYFCLKVCVRLSFAAAERALECVRIDSSERYPRPRFRVRAEQFRWLLFR